MCRDSWKKRPHAQRLSWELCCQRECKPMVKSFQPFGNALITSDQTAPLGNLALQIVYDVPHTIRMDALVLGETGDRIGQRFAHAVQGDEHIHVFGREGAHSRLTGIPILLVGLGLEAGFGRMRVHHATGVESHGMFAVISISGFIRVPPSYRVSHDHVPLLFLALFHLSIAPTR